jgi:hypothetical protein
MRTFIKSGATANLFAGRAMTADKVRPLGAVSVRRHRAAES